MAPRGQQGAVPRGLHSNEVGTWPPTPAEPSVRTFGTQVVARRVKSSEFEVGDIVLAPHIEPSYDRFADSTPSKLGALHVKQRFMIIICKMTDHIIALPLYTHNKTGLAGKQQDQREKYVGTKELKAAK